MRMKLGFLAGAAVGYVLGTRAGRNQFDKIKDQAQKVWENPKVQDNVHKAQSQASDFVKEKAPELREKLGSALGSDKDETPDDLSTFTTSGSDETSSAGSTSTYPTGSNGNRP